MSSNLQLLTSSAEYLLKIVTEDICDNDEDNTVSLPTQLEYFKTAALEMTGSDLQLALLTIRSIILKCVNMSPDGSGIDLDRSRILILTTLIQLHCDIKPDPGEDDLVTPVCATLSSGHVTPSSWLSVICPLSDEIFLHHQVIINIINLNININSYT